MGKLIKTLYKFIMTMFTKVRFPQRRNKLFQNGQLVQTLRKQAKAMVGGLQEPKFFSYHENPLYCLIYRIELI